MSETKASFAERTKRSLKRKLTVAWKIMDTSTFTISVNSSQPWFTEKLSDRLETKKCQEVRLFVHFLQQATTRIKKNQAQKLETELASGRLTYPSGRVTDYNIHRKFLKQLKFRQGNFQHTQ